VPIELADDDRLCDAKFGIEGTGVRLAELSSAHMERRGLRLSVIVLSLTLKPLSVSSPSFVLLLPLPMNGKSVVDMLALGISPIAFRCLRFDRQTKPQHESMISANNPKAPKAAIPTMLPVLSDVLRPAASVAFIDGTEEDELSVSVWVMNTDETAGVGVRLAAVVAAVVGVSVTVTVTP
jgi:hypothetical protein